MTIRAKDLTVVDIVRPDDWQQHIVGVGCDNIVAVARIEFASLIHLNRRDNGATNARSQRPES